MGEPDTLSTKWSRYKSYVFLFFYIFLPSPNETPTFSLKQCSRPHDDRLAVNIVVHAHLASPNLISQFQELTAMGQKGVSRKTLLVKGKQD